jgi:hypothetical protein
MNILQSEKRLLIFVMVDGTGTEVTGLDDDFTLQVSKNGGTFVAGTGTKDEIGSGYYSYELTAAEAGTVGPLAIKITGAGAVQQNLTYDVVEWYWQTDEGVALLAGLQSDDFAMIPAQVFCTVNDLLNDPQPPAGNVELLFQQIKAASQTILQEIGEFIPVNEIRNVNCDGYGNRLFIPPLLDLLGLITNDDTTLAVTDYIQKPGSRHWRNGPYSWLEIDPESLNLGSWSSDADGITIPGRWGLYKDKEFAITTLNGAQNEGAATLQVANGAKLSPGAVLVIEAEQELVTGYSTPVSAVTTLNGGITATDETITLTNGALVNVGEIIRVGLEQMRVLDISGNTVYVQRHWNKTLGVLHSTSTSVDVYRIFTVSRGVNGTTAAAHDTATSVDRYLVPADVLYLCKEIATLMLNKATAGYAGRTGNSELGQVYYNDSFPKFDLERVRQHYQIGSLG